MKVGDVKRNTHFLFCIKTSVIARGNRFRSIGRLQTIATSKLSYIVIRKVETQFFTTY
jgi:hypothetical protein